MENKLREAAENKAKLESTEIKGTFTSIDEVIAQSEGFDKNNKDLEREIGKWRTLNIIAIIFLIIVLLFSLTTVLVKTRYKVKTYEVKLVANEIQVDKELIGTKTTNEILEESKEKGYVSNCMEFYYDPLEKEEFWKDKNKTTYYSVDDLRAEVFGYPITYKIDSIEEIGWGQKPSKCETKVTSHEFSYGIADGSAQEAYPDSTNLEFNGYTEELLYNYMVNVDPTIALNDSGYIVIDERIDVTDEFVDNLLKNAVDDYYLANSDKIEHYSENLDVQDYWYGFRVNNGTLEYVKSHGVDTNGNSMEEVVTDDILGIMEKNIEEYLDEDVTVSTTIPKNSNKPMTVIYLTTSNYVHDPFYIANEQCIF